LKLAFACLLRLEKPRVLDSDDGLVCERLDQPDLPVGERPNSVACDQNDAEHHVAAQERHCQPRARSPPPLNRTLVVFGIACQIGHVNRSPLASGPPDGKLMLRNLMLGALASVAMLLAALFLRRVSSARQPRQRRC
jgi:hypothetical protein